MQQVHDVITMMTLICDSKETKNIYANYKFNKQFTACSAELHNISEEKNILS